MGFFPGAFEKKLGVEALAHQAPLHVGEGGDNGIDLSGSHFFLKGFHCQVTGHGMYPVVGLVIVALVKRSALRYVVLAQDRRLMARLLSTSDIDYFRHLSTIARHSQA